MATAAEIRQDMHERWLPTPAARRHAGALLAAEPSADYAIIPMYQPGKTHGIWSMGQIVRTVPGVVFIGVNRFEASHPDADVPSVAWARDAAQNIARDILGDPSHGTTAYATVARDGHVAVFEGF